MQNFDWVYFFQNTCCCIYVRQHKGHLVVLYWIKATKDGLEIVGFHRGGCKDHYNYGSIFSEILVSISGEKNYDKQSRLSYMMIALCVLY